MHCTCTVLLVLLILLILLYYYSTILLIVPLLLVACTWSVEGRLSLTPIGSSDKTLCISSTDSDIIVQPTLVVFCFSMK